jgi:DNA-binding NarL/FixJ family response regulator
LSDGDVLRIGRTLLAFHHPQSSDPGATAISDDITLLVELTTMQRRVLVALCRPFADGSAFAAPATNQAIADELHLTVEAVKTHLRTLFRKFAIGDVAQNQKRLQLAETAIRAGLVAERESQR